MRCPQRVLKQEKRQRNQGAQLRSLVAPSNEMEVILQTSTRARAVR